MKTLSSFIIEEQEAPSSKPKEYTSKELKSLPPMFVFSDLGVRDSKKRNDLLSELSDGGVDLFDKYSDESTKDDGSPLYEKISYIGNQKQDDLLKANLIKNRELIKNGKLIEGWEYKRVTVDINGIVVSATPSAIDNQLNDLDPNFTTKVDGLPTHDELAEKISSDAELLQRVIETTGFLNKETLKARGDITIKPLLGRNKILKTQDGYSYSYKISSYGFDAGSIDVNYNKNTKERSVKGDNYEYGGFEELSYINFDEAIKIENMTNYCLRKAKTTFGDKAKDIDKPFTSTIGFYPNSSAFVALNDGYINDTDLFNIEDLYKNVRPTNLNEKDFVKRVIDGLNFDWNNYYRSTLARKLKE